MYKRNNFADTKDGERGEAGVLRARVKILLQPMLKTTVRQAVVMQPREVTNGEADIHLDIHLHRGLHARAGRCPEEAVTPQ